MKVEGSEGRIFVEEFPEDRGGRGDGKPAELNILVYGSPALIAAVKELIHRGANLWPDALPEIKGLADLVTNGKQMQDYSNLSSEKKL